MTTKLDSDLKRELLIERQPYTVTLSTTGLKLVPKGRRIGLELRWRDLVSGDAALATALQASVATTPRQRSISDGSFSAKPKVAKKTRR